MLNKYMHVKSRHQAGLPIPQNMECEIIIDEGKFVFRSGGTTFELYFDKITDICIKTEKEIQKQYVSSISGAVAGAALFGPLGAIVGGRAKEKKSVSTSKYMIFTYAKEGALDYISFELLYKQDIQADELIKYYKTIAPPQNNTVVL